MKTVGGHEIKNFRRLDPPELRYERVVHIYEGELVNDYTKKEMSCTWDSRGEVINRNVPKYDIDVKEAEEYLNSIK